MLVQFIGGLPNWIIFLAHRSPSRSEDETESRDTEIVC
jgi:hypothetical protein